MSEKVLSAIQKEQRPWVLHNFGVRPSWQPLMGIVEEYGEFLAADEDQDEEEILDAIADMAIYACDYASGMGWEMGDIDSGYSVPESISVILGRLSHHHLKASQGIRSHEDHEAEGQRALSALILNLRRMARGMGVDFDLLCRTVWDSVKQRDFIAYPGNGRPPQPSEDPADG